MDVFGTVASAIGLIGKLVGYLQAVKGAKEDRLKFLLEVSTLGALLEVLYSRLGDTGGGGGGGNISSKLVKAGIGGPLRACYDALKSTVDGLECLVSNVNARKPSPLAKMMRDFRWPFRQEDIRATLHKIERLKSLVSLALQTSLMGFIGKARNELAVMGINVEEIKSTVASLEADQRAHTKEIESLKGDLVSLGATLQGVANSITAMQNSVTTIDRNQKDQERRAIIKWLSAPEFDQKRIVAFKQRVPGTGEWFLQHPMFAAWKRGMFNVLWCPGNPGVGKSVITSVVIHHLQESIVEDTAVVFIYFEYTNKDDHTTRRLVEAILSQLVQRGMSNSGMQSLQRYMAGSRPALGELWTVLEAELRAYARVFVVIDALEEADAQTWIPLLGHLRELSRISILATSRELDGIAAKFQQDPRLDVIADEGDLRKYIEERISDSTGSFKRILEANPSLRADITAGVAEKAGGMFLLARLHMNSLETKMRVMDLCRALTELPGDLNSAYDATISRINDKDKPLAFRIFSWVLHAAQPMTIEDLQYALAVEDGMTAIDTDCLHDRAHLTSVCVGLVILRSETYYSEPHEYDHSVGLVHYTTQEYLRKCLSAHLSRPAHLAIVCLQYLSFDIFKVSGPLSEESHTELLDTPLAEYAIYSWGDHAHTHYNDPIVHRLAMELLHDHQRVVTLGSLPCSVEYLSAVHLCAYFGLEDCLIDLLDGGYDINSTDSDGDTAVTVAAAFGREDILRLLFAREGVDVNPQGWNGAVPLTRAVMDGYQGIVGLFLGRDDVDVNCRDNEGKTPIAHAAENGHSGVVKMLLERDDVKINSQDNRGFTPLALAMIGEHEAVAQLLLGRDDLDIRLESNIGHTCLIAAAHCKNDGITKCVLARGNININSKDLDGQTALHVAAARGHGAVVELLLGQDGIDVNSMDQAGRTALYLPAFWGDDAVVKLLLGQDGIDINSKDLEGQTVLSVAAARGHDVVAELLIGQDGIDVNLKDQTGRTMLHVAAARGRGTVAKLLLRQGGIDINSKDLNGQTALSVAAARGCDVVMELLLGQDGIDVNSRDQAGQTALYLAAFRGGGAVVKLLLGQDGIDINSKDLEGRTALHAATSMDHDGVVELLLGQDGTGVNLKNRIGQTALHVAVLWGRGTIVKLLLGQDGIDVNPVDSFGETPLDYARDEGDLDAIEILRAAGGRAGIELGGGIWGKIR